MSHTSLASEYLLGIRFPHTFKWKGFRGQAAAIREAEEKEAERQLKIAKMRAEGREAAMAKGAG